MEQIKNSSGKKTILQWELTGIPIIFMAGSMLHFVFEWTNYWLPAAVIAPVNESVWEHFKMCFWPGLCFAVIEYCFLKQVATNFWTGKAFGLLLMPLVIGLGFYGYTALTGKHNLAADILLFLIAIAAGQLVLG